MKHSNIIMYTTEDGLTKIETTFDEDTVWLSVDQMAELFQRDRSVIGKHVRNIFNEGELDKNSVWAKFAYTAADGKTYNVDYYNLDVIISVGYRVYISHKQALDKAHAEYDKYKNRLENNISPVERDFFESIEGLECITEIK